tara:strand:- start:8284 stop:9078 length:795 start_codon:yes stop_codon:yes gene_type:complete
MTIETLLKEGQIQEAIQTLNGEIRSKPSAIDRRALLCDLLCITGDFVRADTQLDAIGKLAPESQAGVSLGRQLIRAEQWRQEVFTQGRVPEFLTEANPRMQLHLRALIALRDGDSAAAHQLLTAAEEMRNPVPGTHGGTAFDDFRDCDDVVGGVLEVLTSTGKYYWVPMEDIRTLEFREATRPRDGLWRQAQLEVENGPTGEVYIPVLYAPAPDIENPDALLGRSTEWSEDEPVRGTGHRTFLVGEDIFALHELSELTFEAPGA